MNFLNVSYSNKMVPYPNDVHNCFVADHFERILSNNLDSEVGLLSVWCEIWDLIGLGFVIVLMPHHYSNRPFMYDDIFLKLRIQGILLS